MFTFSSTIFCCGSSFFYLLGSSSFFLSGVGSVGFLSFFSSSDLFWLFLDLLLSASELKRSGSK